MNYISMQARQEAPAAPHTPNRLPCKKVGAALLLSTLLLSLNACSDSENNDMAVVIENNTISSTTTEITTPAVSPVQTVETTILETTTTTTELAPVVSTLEQQYLALELPDYQIGERMGYIAIDGIVLSQLFQADDGLSTENPFTNYVEEGVAAWGGDLKPGNGVNNTMVIGGHRTADLAPFNKLDEVKAGNELTVVFQTGDAFSATDIATLRYTSQMDAPVQITQYDVDLVTKQLDEPSVRLFTCNTVQNRLTMDFLLTSVEKVVDN